MFKNKYLKYASMLVGGTLFAQVLSVLVLPLLTRLYTPEEFKILAVFTAIVVIISGISGLRLEIAIPKITNDIDKLFLVILSIFFNFIFLIVISLLCLTLFIYFNPDNTQYLLIKPFIWLIPIGVFLTGIYNIFYYWGLQEKIFLKLAVSRVTQSVTSNGFQVGYGYYYSGGLGLLLGYIINFGTGFLAIYKEFYKKNKLNSFFDINLMLVTFKKYKNYPKYSVWEYLAEYGGYYLPIVLMAFFLNSNISAYVFLALKIVNIPLTLLGRAVSNIYYSHAQEKFNIKELDSFTKKTIVSLLKTGLIPIIIIGVAAPFTISYIFGSEWKITGDIIMWMVPVAILQYLSMAIIPLFYITGNESMIFRIQSLGFFIRVGGIVFAMKYFPEFSLLVYLITNFIFYLILFTKQLFLSGIFQLTYKKT